MSDPENIEIAEPEASHIKVSELTEEEFLASKIVEWLEKIKSKNLDDKHWIFEDVQIICNLLNI